MRRGWLTLTRCVLATREGLSRFDGYTFTNYGEDDGLPRDIVRDSKGRLWIGSYDGLVCVDNPGADSPAFRLYSTREGLSSNQVSAIVEDLEGRLYVGTGRGVDRLDPESGRVWHYSQRDGCCSSAIPLVW